MNNKIFKNEAVRLIDEKTIKYDTISSLELMEKAASSCFNFLKKNLSKNKTIYIFAGPGNNGGDALVIAKLMLEAGYICKTYIISTKKLSDDCKKCKQELEEISPRYNCSVEDINSEKDIPQIENGSYIIDGIFGSGLNKPLTGIFEKVVETINNSLNITFSIDIPSGLYGEINNDPNKIIKATHTLSLQFPKLAMLFSENAIFCGKIEIIDIGLNAQAIEEIETSYYLIKRNDVKINKRLKFSHKGNFGHAMLVAGEYGKIGACLLAANSCVRSGVGLLTIYTPQCGYDILQTSLPEAMVVADNSQKTISKPPIIKNYSAIALGPGIGTAEQTKEAIFNFLKTLNIPSVIDADALNIIATNKSIIKELPENTIITPHPKEFERLFGSTKNSYERLELQKAMSIKHKIIIILKGHNTSISDPIGNIYFNSTGNPGMATAGSGDVLTGIILSFLAQGYTSLQSAINGVYIHGKAGDYAYKKKGSYSLIASDIIKYLPKAFSKFENIVDKF